jgi:hypothetical protein
LPMRCMQFCAQFTGRHGTKGRVDGFLADTHREIVREHTWQYARDLLRRVPLFEQLLDLRPQETIRRQQSRFTTVRSSHASTLLGKNCAVTTRKSGSTSPRSLQSRARPLVSCKLSTHRTCASVQTERNGSNGGSFLKAQLNQNSLFTSEMLVH